MDKPLAVGGGMVSDTRCVRPFSVLQLLLICLEGFVKSCCSQFAHNKLPEDIYILKTLSVPRCARHPAGACGPAGTAVCGHTKQCYG